ncbi:aldo/keto reductase [Pseudomonas sp. OIL-1]|uniref:aldo/keto reductase n=1 Tax=Pseudomonas sp. OIL-1 TaxID=2706126 RepID=UPI0013A73E19|nr:aldo/keto reductase [Pseudomonas sp. OIL-1]QIB52111.1 aldo/keto reductase [Pseudomonas sp. OIL-1]
MKTVNLGGVNVPVIGQGTWHMGEQRTQRKQEVAALREGLDLGMTLVDTAEMYADGGAEEVVGEAIAGVREQVFLTSKVLPHNASRSGVIDACERSLRRLNTDVIDLYLLHWPGRHPVTETIEGFERLLEQGKIKAWGVSNFDLDDMQALPAGCATNQVLYNLESRGIEYDLLPWQQSNAMPLMAYCPLSQGGSLLQHPALKQIAGRHAATTAQIALAWTIRQSGVVAIPKAASIEHIRLNAAATELQLSQSDLALLDKAFPPPMRKQPLEVV